MRHRYDAQWRRYRTATFRAYGIPHAEWSRYTVDHLVPIELGSRPFGIIGGAWDLRNVWPEPKTKAEQKDAVENALHAAVCYRDGYRSLHLTIQQADTAFLARLDANARRVTGAPWRRVTAMRTQRATLSGHVAGRRASPCYARRKNSGPALE